MPLNDRDLRPLYRPGQTLVKPAFLPLQRLDNRGNLMIPFPSTLADNCAVAHGARKISPVRRDARTASAVANPASASASVTVSGG